MIERAIAEVGAELANRMRNGVTTWRRPALALAGTALGIVGPLWSDASLVLLERDGDGDRPSPA